MVRHAINKIKVRPKDTHKGDYGHVFVLAGSVGMTGAAYLTSQATLLSGSGLVTLGIPKSLNPIMEAKLTEVMTLPLDETAEQSFAASSEKRILDFASKADVVAIGPGISRNAETQGLLRNLIKKIDKPIVLDADGLNAFSGKISLLSDHKKALVITPHPGEMARLAGETASAIQRDRRTAAKKASQSCNCITVLKGSRTVVASAAGKIYVNVTGNPGMATGGVGDVLTGIIASFIGQGIEPFGAAKLGAYLHGRAGDLAIREKGEISLIATDLLDKLPAVFRNL